MDTPDVSHLTRSFLLLEKTTMVRTPSTMLPLGTQAPDFSLINVDGKTVSLSDFHEAPALLVMFICNHCPYVKHVADELARLGQEYMAKGAAVVAINSNDASAYPEDDAAGMAREASAAGFSFPYLHDEGQHVAQAFRAACTPDFFVFDRERRLAYRGQFDGSRPNSATPVTGADLRGALDALLAGSPVPSPQRPSVGCNIKWKPGNAPGYA